MVELTPELQQATIAKIRNRCIPILLLAFVVSYLDRVNVGFAAITANKDLGLTASTYGWGAGLLFLGYTVFELPSNQALERFGARVWLARIMVTWGVIGCGMALVREPIGFYIARFVLGAAEAGLFPGVILYLTYWFPRRYRARYISWFALGIPLSSVIGSPISGLIISQMNGVMGVKGWQWLFVLESLPAIVLGIAVFLWLKDRPSEASWLTPPEKTWLLGELEQERANQTETRHSFAWRMLGDRRVLILAGFFFLTGTPSYGLSLWLPQIIKSSGLSSLATGFVTAIPFVFGCVAMVVWGARSDRRRERVWHAAIPAVAASVGLAAGAFSPSPVLQLCAICLAAAGIYGLKGPFLAMVSEAFADTNAAAGIALVSTLGNLSGFVAPYMVGVIIDRTGSYRLGLLALGVQPLLAVALLWASNGGHGRARREA